MEQIVQAGGAAGLDVGQGSQAPAGEAPDEPAVPRNAQVSTAFLSRRRSSEMLHRVLIASAAVAILLVTIFTDDAFARGGGGGGVRAGGFHGGAVRAEATAAARSQLGDTEAALWLCAVDATVIGVPTVIAATVSVRRQWARPRSARLRLGPTIAAAAAKTPTATMFARITERRDNDGLCALCPQHRV
jgi:hypothetical protein